MAWVTVDRAQPGMTLASPVTDRLGRLLIPAGADLTARHVDALATWGVDQVEIVSDEPEFPEIEVTPELRARARSEVARRFRHAGGAHPFLDRLAELAVERRIRWLARRGGGAAAPGATGAGGMPER